MALETKQRPWRGRRVEAARDFMLTAGSLQIHATIIIGLCLICSLGCSSSAKKGEGRMDNAKAAAPAPAKTTEQSKAEPKSQESKSVDPAVQSELEKAEAERRATLLKDAQSALEETRNALAALDKGDKQAALAALERASGKLDLLVARDTKMALAPVSVTTTLLDLYASPDTVKKVVKDASDELSNNHVQIARHLVQDLASEADIHLTSIPLATYPAAIRAVAPLVDAGKTEEAKAALNAALHTLVVETFIIPLPQIRAEAMLEVADKLASQKDRKEEDKAKLRTLIDATRHELQLAEALGYGTKDNYKSLHAQLDEVQKKADEGAGKGVFDKLRNSVKNFKFLS